MRCQQDVTFIEAEAFEDRGGWVMDSQAALVMGSPYLMAHGCGVPVANAKTIVKLRAGGSLRVVARTRDWVAPHGPGRFRLLINGVALPTTLGIGGDGHWRWHTAGHIRATAGQTIAVELNDLTGFNARCDAIAFVPSDQPDPPDDTQTLQHYRRAALGVADQPMPEEKYDLVVAGGGYAGVCAAIAAARAGLRVALI